MHNVDHLRITSRIVALEPGLYIFRFATQLIDAEIVMLTLQTTPLGKAQVDFFPGEGVTHHTLVRLGDCIIARVISDAARILITEYRSPDATTVVDLRIDRIDTSANIVRATHSTPAKRDITPLSPTPVSAEKLRMSGFVQGVGEVNNMSAAPGVWMGLPASSQALEGFSISWEEQPAGVDLIYTCDVHELGQMPATRSGSFVGTRGRNLPIYSISFLLAGPRANEYELSGEVAFSGQPPLALQPGIALTGQTGREPLVALRPRIVTKPIQYRPHTPDPAAHHNGHSSPRHFHGVGEQETKSKDMNGTV